MFRINKFEILQFSMVFFLKHTFRKKQDFLILVKHEKCSFSDSSRVESLAGKSHKGAVYIGGKVEKLLVPLILQIRARKKKTR